jgi:hypothetical protein
VSHPLVTSPQQPAVVMVDGDDDGNGDSTGDSTVRK